MVQKKYSERTTLRPRHPQGKKTSGETKTFREKTSGEHKRLRTKLKRKKHWGETFRKQPLGEKTFWKHL